MSGFNLARFNPFLYRSYIYDSETGLYYLKSRYYDPEIGRFLNADEPTFIGTNDSITSYNAYVYGDNNSVNNVDYTGKFAISTISSLTYIFFTLMLSAMASETIRLSATYSHSIPFRDSFIWEYPRINYSEISLPKVEVVPSANTIYISEYEYDDVWHSVKVNKIIVELIKKKISNKIKTPDGKIDLSKFSKKPNNGPPKWIGPLGYELVKDLAEHKGKAYKLFQYSVRIATISFNGTILGK